MCSCTRTTRCGDNEDEGDNRATVLMHAPTHPLLAVNEPNGSSTHPTYETTKTCQWRVAITITTEVIATRTRWRRIPDHNHDTSGLSSQQQWKDENDDMEKSSTRFVVDGFNIHSFFLLFPAV